SKAVSIRAYLRPIDSVVTQMRALVSEPGRRKATIEMPPQES
ncbi:MAG: hypothetical protein ACI91B_003159, partial [Planctomycetota bacterium]